MKVIFKTAGIAVPENKRSGSFDEDLVLRNLDCAVVNYLHQTRFTEKFEPFDTVRGAFFEGAPLYDGAGIRAKTHVQLCVRNLKQIRGYFWPRPVA